jgi:nicotinamide-nucleotide amidase
VAYTEAVKTGVLGVEPGAIKGNGIVSEVVARAMAEGARRTLGSDWGVGITGWAGPGLDVPHGDDGLIWIAVSGPDGITAEDSRFGGYPREATKLRATQSALDQLRRRLLTASAASA